MAETEKRKVLLAVDGSTYSTDAFNFYIENLHKDGDVIHVITVPQIPAMPIGEYPYPLPIDVYEEWKANVSKCQTEARKLLENCGMKLKKKFPDCNPKLISDPGHGVGELICWNAHQDHVNLVIMGSRGLGVLRRTFLGSASSYVVHHAHCAVVVVPPKEHK